MSSAKINMGIFLTSLSYIDAFCASRVTWEPMGDGKKLISLADNHLLLWDLQESSTKAVVRSVSH